MTKDDDITMSRIDTGLAYVYQYGNGMLTNIDGSKEALVANLASQKDAYIKRGEGSNRFPYLDEDDAQAKLSVRAEYIENSQYAVCVASYMESTIKEMIQKLTEMYS